MPTIGRSVSLRKLKPRGLRAIGRSKRFFESCFDFSQKTEAGLVETRHCDPSHRAPQRLDQVRAGFQFAERISGNTKVIFPTSDLMLSAGPATYVRCSLTTDENGVVL
jgi:hypothetical protein